MNNRLVGPWATVAAGLVTVGLGIGYLNPAREEYGSSQQLTLSEREDADARAKTGETFLLLGTALAGYGLYEVNSTKRREDRINQLPVVIR